MKRLTKEEFILRANNAHNNIFDYSLVEYLNNYTKVIIVCPIHGQFDQEPGSHLNGAICPKCAFEQRSKNYTRSTKEFISLAKKKHKNKFDYSLVDYQHSQIPIKIKCVHHDLIFNQLPNSHLLGKGGCPKCAYENNGSFNSRYKKSGLGQKLGHIYCVYFQHKQTNESFFKIGITSKDVGERFKRFSVWNITTIEDVILTNYECAVLEQKIHNNFRELKYTPSIKFDGYTECFSEKISIDHNRNL